MQAPFIRSPYNYDTNAASDESGLYTDFDKDPSKTVQSQKDEADINVIVKRFGLTGQLPQNVRVPTYGDFDTVNDFQSAMNAIRLAQESFDAMPADVRARFNNDPAAFVDFCSDEQNLEEMRKLGLAVPKQIEDNADDREVPRETKVKSDVNREDVSSGDEDNVRGRVDQSASSQRATSGKSGGKS